MRNLLALLVVAALAVSLASCTESATSVVAPKSPRFDGGPTIGSGSKESTNTPPTPAVQSDTTLNAAGGGPTIGSGS